mgnify:CR=1 FL=1
MSFRNFLHISRLSTFCSFWRVNVLEVFVLKYLERRESTYVQKVPETHLFWKWLISRCSFWRVNFLEVYVLKYLERPSDLPAPEKLWKWSIWEWIWEWIWEIFPKCWPMFFENVGGEDVKLLQNCDLLLDLRRMMESCVTQEIRLLNTIIHTYAGQISAYCLHTNPS